MSSDWKETNIFFIFCIYRNIQLWFYGFPCPDGKIANGSSISRTIACWRIANERNPNSLWYHSNEYGIMRNGKGYGKCWAKSKAWWNNVPYKTELFALSPLGDRVQCQFKQLHRFIVCIFNSKEDRTETRWNESGSEFRMRSIFISCFFFAPISFGFVLRPSLCVCVTTTIIKATWSSSKLNRCLL